MQRKTNSVRSLTPAADYTNYEGYGVTLSVVNGVTVATLSASATVPIDGIILEGGTVAQGVSVAILGAYSGELDVKLNGAVTDGDKICQAADGSFKTDPGNGNARVQVGVISNTGVAGDLQPMFPRTPLILT